MINRLKKYLDDNGLRYEIVDLSSVLEDSVDMEKEYRKYVESLKEFLEESQDEKRDIKFNEPMKRTKDNMLKGCNDLSKGCVKKVKPIRDVTKPSNKELDMYNEKIDYISSLLSKTKEERIEYCIENIIKDFSIFIDASTCKDFVRNSFVDTLYKVIAKSNEGRLAFMADKPIRLEIAGLKSLFVIPFMHNKNMFAELETIIVDKDELVEQKKEIEKRILNKVAYIAFQQVDTITNKINNLAKNPDVILRSTLRLEDDKVFVNVVKSPKEDYLL